MIEREQLQIEMSKFFEEPQNLYQIAKLRRNPGILILSSDLRILHMNRMAWELLGQSHNDKSLVGSREVLLPEIADICAQVRSITEIHSDSGYQEHDLVRLASWREQKLLLRGFQFRVSRWRSLPLIFILIEVIARRQLFTEKARKLFNLTEREATIVKYIARGATNKEISAELQITEQTVKVHVRHVMIKTNTTTRTGILTRVLHFQNPLEPRFPSEFDSCELNNSLS